MKYTCFLKKVHLEFVKSATFSVRGKNQMHLKKNSLSSYFLKIPDIHLFGERYDIRSSWRTFVVLCRPLEVTLGTVSAYIRTRNLFNVYNCK